MNSNLDRFKFEKKIYPINTEDIKEEPKESFEEEEGSDLSGLSGACAVSGDDVDVFGDFE